MKAVLADRREAFEALADRLDCVPRIVAARNERIGRPLSEEELVDVVQNTLLIVWRKLPEFEGRSTLETWIYRISSLEIMNALRKARRRRDVAAPPEVLEGVADRAATPARIEFEDLYLGLERLTDEERDIVRRKHFGELTFEAIGKEIGLTVDMVKSRYYRSLAKLQQFLASRREGDG
ncbi:MAG: sigma-70 family RNA polymerase sigma factor [Planctomycetota bacterium]